MLGFLDKLTDFFLFLDFKGAKLFFFLDLQAISLTHGFYSQFFSGAAGYFPPDTPAMMFSGSTSSFLFYLN